MTKYITCAIILALYSFGSFFNFKIYMKISTLEKSILAIFTLIFVFQLTFPQYSHAYEVKNNKVERIKLPVADQRQARKTIKVLMTAYSSTPDQTDDSPFITANGSHVRDGIIAANFLPFGTKVKFPELYGDKVFSVEDRMHKRFSNRMDIWMETRQEAINFGVKYVTVEIY